jgi:hypothetical protein
MIIEDQPYLKSTLPRDRYLHIVSAALSAGNNRFAREAVLNWLATYPGDMLAGLYYAQALVGENHTTQAFPILEGLCLADPEFVDAAKTLMRAVDTLPESVLSGSLATRGEPGVRGRTTRFLTPIKTMRTYWFALTGTCNDRLTLVPWGEDLWNARQATEQGDYKLAEALIEEALDQGADHPLVCIYHLQLLSRKSEIPLEVKSRIAHSYHQRWPDCLACMLWLADWSMKGGDSGQAVAWLHQAAARDIGGQVSSRLWGEEHPYQSLWPERLELPLNMPIPAEVATVLGWNRLPPGIQLPSSVPDEKDNVSNEESVPLQGLEEAISPENPSSSVNTGEEDLMGTGQTLQPVDSGSDGLEDAHEENWVPPEWALEADSKQPDEPSTGIGAQRGAEAASKLYEIEEDLQLRTSRTAAPATSRIIDRDLNQVSEELGHLAARLKLPGLTHLDGRYPVYVVLTVRSKLQAIYGFRAAAILESEMNMLVQAVRDRRGWGAMLFFADDPVHARSLEIKPARLDDPWELKLALADLDAALEKRGQRIGAVLIVGGSEVVPFHHLPNPVDDQDVDVPSDNPYATRNENYFIPEWPVGRLPGGAGEDARLLVNALRHIRLQHAAAPNTGKNARRAPWFKRCVQVLHGFLSTLTHGRVHNFGYSAAVWQKMAALVFSPIGKANKLHISPPLGVYGSTTDGSPMNGSPMNGTSNNPITQASEGIPSLLGRLGYFNLHGVVDAAEWFGQRDLLDLSQGPDFPVALRPQDIGAYLKSGEEGLSLRESPLPRSPLQGIPQIVFTEACYGLHIQGRKMDEAISLKFLEAGSLAVAGSTCMTYGSIAEPLTAADLLGHAFWTFLKQGMTAGEALRHAKIYLAGEMDRRQGYLDGEDQKTLISFILYGDPLAQSMANGRAPKSIRYLDQPLGNLKTVCDRVLTPSSPMPVPKDVLTSVRKVVAQYLPGMSDAQLAFSQEREQCNGKEHTCPTSQLEVKQEKSPRDHKVSRRLVLLSKHVTRSEGVHPQYARLTLDDQGKLVKLVVSR